MTKVSAVAALIALLGTAPVKAAGRHVGEAGKIHASVEFLSPSGQTTTDATGITYRSGGWSFHESKVYVSRFWGTFPLYFIGQTMRFRVTLRNTAAKGKKPFNIRIEALNNVLDTNGTPGMQLAAPQNWSIANLRPGQSISREFSIYLAPNPNLPSGLDVTKVRILHGNRGTNPNAGLIKESLAVWCPPSLRDSSR